MMMPLSRIEMKNCQLKRNYKKAQLLTILHTTLQNIEQHFQKSIYELI